jgi:hypothetical protein
VKIYHFYHIYADGKWEDPVTEHIDALIKYSLYDSLDKMFIGFVGNNDNIFKVKQFLNDKINYETLDEQLTGWEQLTLEYVHSYSKNNINESIFYAHTKSSSNPSKININWRKNMTYYNIVEWKERYKNLSSHDTVGCHFVKSNKSEKKWLPNGVWAGNYWWASCKYLSTIQPLQYNSRHDAETWILSSDHKKIYDACPGFPSMNLFKTNW